MQKHSRGTHSHTHSYSPQVLRGFYCRPVPKEPQCSLKLHSGQASDGNQSYLEVIAALLELTATTGLPREGLKALRLPLHLWSPHRRDVTNKGGHGKRQRYQNYIFKDARVSSDIVCDIWGTPELTGK